MSGMIKCILSKMNFAAGFLNLVTIEVFGQVIICCGVIQCVVLHIVECLA